MALTNPRKLVCYFGGDIAMVPPLTRDIVWAASLARQNGLCMVHRKPSIGWWLLLASSLAWFGCKDPGPRSQDVNKPVQEGAVTSPLPKAPPTVVPLQIVNPPAPPKLTSAYHQLTIEAPPNNAGSRASLLPPMPVHVEPVPAARPTPPPVTQVSALRTLYRFAAERFAATPGYIARLRRREVVDGKERPEELILFKYRKDPSSIYMRWLGNEAKGRELLYVKGQYDDMLHILPGSGETGLFHLTSRSVERHPDGPRGLGKERCPVAELGVGPWIERFGRLLDAYERGDPKAGTLKYLGSLKRPEAEAAVEGVMHTIPPGVEINLPKGGQRLWFFDSTLHFPVLVITHDAQGQEVEYYCFDRFLFPPGRFSDADFNPANLVRH
jgi:hypothetical protein